MTRLDLVVFALYMVGLVGMGSIYIRRIKNAHQMFAAGGRSPWWVSGLSAFMTLFSAGTFVVWGGIAYLHGVVGISILFVTGLGALLVGRFLAGYWRSFGVESAAEFLHIRFGKSIVQFYTWLQGTIGLFGMGGAIYALSVIICALVPLPEGHLLANPATGELSVTFMSVVICLVVVLVAFGGGLWAVLMTDVLQFIILTIAVILVVPLLFAEVGGLGAFIEKAPEGFFAPAAAEFTWIFLAGWVVVHFFKVGGEWGFVQRYLCVPESKDARKAAYLFGALYLVSPVFWMLPPMLFRLIRPGEDPEQAYILACQVVLPAGLLGLTIAAMSSATASMVTTQLNVFAGAFTREFYQSLLRPRASEKELVVAGRFITLLLGATVLAGAILIPRLGTYTGWVLATTALLTGPLVIPTIWGLFSKKTGLGTAWTITIAGLVIGVTVKFGLTEGGLLEDAGFLSGIAALVQVNEMVTDIVVGTFVPLFLLACSEVILRRPNPGAERIAGIRRKERDKLPLAASLLPARLCGWAIGIIAVMMAALAVVVPARGLLVAAFAVGLGVISYFVLRSVRRAEAAAEDTPRP